MKNVGEFCLDARPSNAMSSSFNIQAAYLNCGIGGEQ